MKAIGFGVLVGLLCLAVPSEAERSSPKVQVYSRTPGGFGKPNTLICHASNFHPPELSIQLFKNGKEMDGAEQSDLAFESNWHYHLTKRVRFTPLQNDKFVCIVTHMGESKPYIWEVDE